MASENDKLNIEKVQSDPSFPMTTLDRVRVSELAKRLQEASTRDYIEASVITQALDLVRVFLPMVLGVK